MCEWVGNRSGTLDTYGKPGEQAPGEAVEMAGTALPRHSLLDACRSGRGAAEAQLGVACMRFDATARHSLLDAGQLVLQRLAPAAGVVHSKGNQRHHSHAREAYMFGKHNTSGQLKRSLPCMQLPPQPPRHLPTCAPPWRRAG